MFNAKAHKDYLIDWIKEYIEKTKSKGIVLGISGGIDSAVIAYLAKEARIPTIGVWMNINSSTTASRNALRVFEDTNIRRKWMDLTPVWESMIDILKTTHIYKDNEEYNQRLTASALRGDMKDTENIDYTYMSSNSYKMSISNIKARLRMTTVYQVAQEKNMLVVGTSNAIEMHLGYFTKWGDAAADFYPISNLLKSEIYELAKELGVNKRIIETPPSADLWEGQTDEKHMGITYENIEKYLKGEKVDKKIVKIIEEMHVSAQHKLTNKLTSPEYKMG